MAKDPQQFEALTATAQKTADQTVQLTQKAMENYFNWVQTGIPSIPWINTDLNKKLLRYATENFTNTVKFLQNLSAAKDFQEVAKIQTEFMEAQLQAFHERTQELGEAISTAAKAQEKSS
jgi:hypothetical protein